MQFPKTGHWKESGNPEVFMKQPAVYIMANKRNGTFHTGVTGNPVKRVCEHKNRFTKGFVAKYACKLLVY